METMGAELSEGIFHYKFTAILLLFRFGYIYFSRKRFKFIKGRVPRPSSDATWLLPVYVWGIEFVMYIKWWFDCREISGSFVSPLIYFFQFLFSAALLIVVIGLCYLQESLARHFGMGVRESQITIPLPLLISILSVWLFWITALMMLFRYPYF